MSNARECEVCRARRSWRLLRFGDNVVTWACDHHLVGVLRRLQREGERTEIVLARETVA